MIRNVAILGATGSIGASTLDVIARHPERYRVWALSGRRVEALAPLCRRFAPRWAVVGDEAAARRLRPEVPAETEVLAGPRALEEVAAQPECDVVVAAIVGAAGLLSTLAAVRTGKRVLLANKEALVMAGELVMAAARRSGAALLPIDSEHNAIFQCLPAACRDVRAAGVERIWLSASGGPFLTRPLETLAAVTPQEACAHPNWRMGRKISVDSATMMNKGLELIEACWLFGVRPQQVEVVIHPQSIVHSLVAYVDGSLLAQLGHPDMRTPIAHALAWPERIAAGVAPLDLAAVARLDFAAPDEVRFPSLALARRAAEAGGDYPAALNAANEEAVAAFLAGRIPFPRIVEVVGRVLDEWSGGSAAELEAVLEADRRARERARRILGE
ncbi:MAG: 1-deoxy-D-xylulose 5-phosphate reductoisomerase [Porticoccaceae bacterium]|nr:MAG: 1-deoxy-D-xylulose 5-phosphate reductoisomerase [Porticoccaceae bacterium]